MPIYEFEGKSPRIDPTAWVAPTAVVVGDVSIGSGCYIGWGAILRGDYGTIEVGAGTALEEGVIVHSRPGDKTVFGIECTIGHGAMVHNAVIEDYAVLGMRSVVSDFARVGTWSIVGESALIRSKQDIPPESIALGAPAQVVGSLRDTDKKMWTMAKELYKSLAKRYPEGLKEVSGC